MAETVMFLIVGMCIGTVVGLSAIYWFLLK
jgi:hypothetical protein